MNGKRRHNSALVNINGTVGRGSVGTDLNVIPMASIKRIEVLRDGAAAQYGSDAIAGVINIQLKDDTTGVAASSTVGQTMKATAKCFRPTPTWALAWAGAAFWTSAGNSRTAAISTAPFDDTAPLIYLGGNGGNYPGGTAADTEQERRDLKAQDDALVAQPASTAKTCA